MIAVLQAEMDQMRGIELDEILLTLLNIIINSDQPLSKISQPFILLAEPGEEYMDVKLFYFHAVLGRNWMISLFFKSSMSHTWEYQPHGILLKSLLECCHKCLFRQPLILCAEVKQASMVGEKFTFL